MDCGHQLTAQSLVIVAGESALLEVFHKRRLPAKHRFGKRRPNFALDELGVLTEELEVAAPVEDEEALLVGMRPVEGVEHAQPLAQACAAADHLPELDLRAHLLEEHQVHDLRHVDASVHHVHRHGDHRQGLQLELVDDGV